MWERVWLHPAEEAELWADEADITALEAVYDTTSAPGGVLASAPDPETIAQARRLAKLKKTLAYLRALGAPGAANLVTQEVRKLEKVARCGGREDQAQSKDKLRAFVAKSLDAERKLVQSRHMDALHKRKIVAQVNAKTTTQKEQGRAMKKQAFAASHLCRTSLATPH